MTFTVSLWELSLFIIAVAFVILLVTAIPALIQLRRTGRALQEFSEDGKELLADLKDITRTLNGSANDVNDAVGRIRDVTLKATGVAEGVIDAVKAPLYKMAAVMAGVTYALKHFRKGGD